MIPAIYLRWIPSPWPDDRVGGVSSRRARLTAVVWPGYKMHVAPLTLFYYIIIGALSLLSSPHRSIASLDRLYVCCRFRDSHPIHIPRNLVSKNNLAVPYVRKSTTVSMEEEVRCQNEVTIARSKIKLLELRFDVRHIIERRGMEVQNDLLGRKP